MQQSASKVYKVNTSWGYRYSFGALEYDLLLLTYDNFYKLWASKPLKVIIRDRDPLTSCGTLTKAVAE